MFVNHLRLLIHHSFGGHEVAPSIMSCQCLALRHALSFHTEREAEQPVNKMSRQDRCGFRRKCVMDTRKDIPADFSATPKSIVHLGAARMHKSA